MMRRVYTRDEAEKIVKYIVDKKAYALVKGNKLWKEMEASQIVNRTWQSLKQYYLKNIMITLNAFHLSEEEKDNIKEGFYKIKINKHPPKKIHLQTEFSDDECSQEKENTSQNLNKDFWIDTKPSTSKSIEKGYIQKPTTSKSIEKEYIQEPTTSKSIEKEYIQEPTTSKSIDKELIQQPTTSKSIYNETSTSKSINKENIEDMNEIETIVIDSDSDDSSASTYCVNFEHTSLGVYFKQDNPEEFSLAEDLRLIKFITKDPEYLEYIHSNVIYKMLAYSEMFNKSWTQLKDRFINYILPNFKQYNCLQLEQIISKTGKPK